MMKAKPVLLNLTLVGITAGALLASVGIQLVWAGLQWVNQPLHSAMEALGGLAAIVMAFVLLQGRQEPGGGKFSLLALGFLSMGVFEEFHAIAEQDNGAVFLRSVASLVGGIGFALVWLPLTEIKGDRKSTRLNSSHGYISYAVFCLKKKKETIAPPYGLTPATHKPPMTSSCS